MFVFGCSAPCYFASLLERRLRDLGWEVPGLEGYRAAIELTRMMARLGVSASGLAFLAAPVSRARHIKTM